MTRFKETERIRTKYDHDSELTQKVKQYLESMLSRGYSPYTAESRWYDLRYFIIWCEERSVKTAREVTGAMLERYRMALYHQRLPDGRPVTVTFQYTRLKSIAGFFRWLKRSKQIEVNPALEMEFPKLGDRLPKYILSSQEADAVINHVDLSHPMGYRDRAMLEVFYSTGIRRSELKRLKVQDVDMERGILKVIEGKGKKDRVIPIGERAVMWLRKYLDELRWRLGGCDEETLFLSRKGGALSDDVISEMVSRNVRQTGIGKQGSCHLFRHTMATLMLEGGADTRFIQEMLGHARLETTQIYTRVSIRKLKEVHDKTHPGANLKPRQHQEAAEEKSGG